MERFLQRLGVPDRCFDLAKAVIENCEHCHAYQPVPRRPKYGAELAGWFGDCLVIDLFFMWNQTFLLMIDEAIRYKISEQIKNKDGKTIMTTLLMSWFRYFGPPKVLKSDQEGGITADDTAKTCERFSIHRALAGSDDTGNTHFDGPRRTSHSTH